MSCTVGALYINKAVKEKEGHWRTKGMQALQSSRCKATVYKVPLLEGRRK